MKLNVTIDLSEIYGDGDGDSVKELILADLNREVGNSVEILSIINWKTSKPKLKIML